MRKLIDRLMARLGYVPRSAYDGAQNFFINETRRLTNALVAERQRRDEMSCVRCYIDEAGNYWRVPTTETVAVRRLLCS